MTFAVVYFGRRGRSVNIATSGERHGSFLDQKFKREQGEWALWGSILDRFAVLGLDKVVVTSNLKFVSRDLYDQHHWRQHYFEVDVTCNGQTERFTFFMSAPDTSGALGFKFGPSTWSTLNPFSPGLKPVRPNGRKRIKTRRQLRAHFARLNQ
ncbi:MAG: hypothetical protein P8N13_09565 [Ilumatobacter sp.]|nr:hypothetical protein [Ilumatobacter sp.]